MAVLSVDLSYIAPTTQWSRVRAWVEPSATNGWVGESAIVLGDSPVEIASDGTGTVTLVNTPAGVRYQFCMEYPLPGTDSTDIYRSGWFELTADADLKDLATSDVPGPPSTPLLDHIERTTDVHGIPDTALLETQAGAQAKADAVAEGAADDLAEHVGDPTNAHSASAIGYSGGPLLPASTVELALDRLDERWQWTASPTDLNAIVQQGRYYVTSANPNNPAGSAGYLEVSAVSGSVVMQRFWIANQIGSGNFYLRATVDGAVVWSAWRRLVTEDRMAAGLVSYGGGVVLPTGTVEAALDALDSRTAGALAPAGNLNTFLTPGSYLVSGANSTALNNSPAPAYAGVLQVMRATGSLNYQQVWVSFSAGAGLGIFVRTSGDGGATWSTWNRLDVTAHAAQVTGAHAATAISYGGGQALPAGSLEEALDALALRAFETNLAASTTDLNDITAPGTYFVDGAATNSPTASAGHLFVTGLTNGNYQTQAFRPHTTNSIYERRRYVPGGPAWTPWDRVVTTELSNVFKVGQRIESPSTALSFRRTNGTADARDWHLYGEVDGSVMLSPTSDAGLVNAPSFRIWRDSSFGFSGGVRHFTGTGSPEGVVTASPGSTYNDIANTNGAKTWRKDSGTGSSGWRVTNGDTGWREITASISGFTPEAGTVSIRRVNQRVTLRFLGLKSPAGLAVTNFLTIPSGFTIGTRKRLFIDSDMGSGSVSTVYQILLASTSLWMAGRTNGGVWTGGWDAAHPLSGLEGWDTDVTFWPTTLPGNPTT